MLDDPITPGTREYYWQIASQLGKTLCLIFQLEYAIHWIKKSAVMVRPTKEAAGDWNNEKFLPTIEATPAMQGLLAEPRKRGSRSTAMRRKFPGGTFKLIGAGSPSGFRSTSAPIVLQDEIDSFPVIKEGDPVTLGDRAAKTFAGAWKGKSSTPTLAGFSRIESGMDRSDKRRYFVPCPCCGIFQWLKTENNKFSFTAEESQFTGHPNDRTWEIGDFAIRDTRRAFYVCEVCFRGWTDAQRIASIMSGHIDNQAVVVGGVELRALWKPTTPFSGIVGRYLNEMYLTMGRKEGFVSYLHQFAEDFISAKRGGRETLMVWTNLQKGETFEESTEKIDWKTIMDRAEDYESELPMQAVWPIAAIDIQRDRIEILVYAFGDSQESWAVDYHVIYGDFDSEEMQREMTDWVLSRRYQHGVLGPLKINSVAVDSGHQTKVHSVYRVCAQNWLEGWMAVKGSSIPMGSIFAPFKDKRFNLECFRLDTEGLKDRIFTDLKLSAPGDRFIHFPKPKDAAGLPVQWKRFDSRFYQQLCSERKFPQKMPNNQWKFVWKKISQATRNEVLDMTVYCWGAYEITKKDAAIRALWAKVKAELQKREFPDLPVSAPVSEPKRPITPPHRGFRQPNFGRGGGFGGFNPLGV